MRMLRLTPGPSWLGLGLTAAVLLAGCGDTPDDPAVSESSPAATITTTTAPPATTGPAMTDTPTATDSVPTTSPSAGPNESPEPPRRRLQSCSDVAFAPASEDLASRITVVGMTCEQAQALVRAVRAQHNFVTGPRRFTSGGLECRIRTTEDPAPVGHYTCTGSGGVIITWVKT